MNKEEYALESIKQSVIRRVLSQKTMLGMLVWGHTMIYVDNTHDLEIVDVKIQEVETCKLPLLDNHEKCILNINLT